VTATQLQNLSTLFPTITRVQDDTGASPTNSGHGYPSGASSVAARVLHVGDVVRFSCQATDPRGRELGWWLHPYGYDPTPRTIGSEVELQWTVGPQSIGHHVYVGIGMAANAEYHREGGHGEQGRDGWVRYLYTVSS
jgi:hypothetical protein